MPLDIKMVRIPDGSLDHEQYFIYINSFCLGAYAITQAQYEAVMQCNPVSIERFQDPDYPVIYVSPQEAEEFCSRLSQLTGDRYRLPTQQEWEYACRAGTTGPYSFKDPIAAGCNWDGTREGTSYARSPCRVDRGLPNGFGLYHMHGNVWEWCQPNNGSNPKYRPAMGGSWYSYPHNCRSNSVYPFDHDERRDIVGFRVACD